MNANHIGRSVIKENEVEWQKKKTGKKEMVNSRFGQRMKKRPKRRRVVIKDAPQQIMR